MGEGEVLVGHAEPFGTEGFDVRAVVAAGVARAPAAVNQFPFAVVDAHGVPGVVAVVGRD